MVIRDLYGNMLSEGEAVSFSLGTGTTVPARIGRVSSGLDNTQPVAFLEITVPCPIHSNGVIPGVTAIKDPGGPKVIEG